MYILDFFWRVYFGNFCYSDGGCVGYTCFVVFIILLPFDIRAILFRDFLVYLALYGDTFLSLHNVRKYDIFFMTYKEVIQYAKY